MEDDDGESSSMENLDGGVVLVGEGGRKGCSVPSSLML
jgi:hypothetical protein